MGCDIGLGEEEDTIRTREGEPKDTIRTSEGQPKDTMRIENGQRIEINKNQKGVSEITVVAPGEDCDRSQSIACPKDHTCVKDLEFPDKMGVCEPIFVDHDRDCSLDPDEVCGQIGRKNKTYLNTCFAQKFGAEVLYAGRCQIDVSQAYSCDATVQGLGSCSTVHTGFEFNSAESKCEKALIEGCEVQRPFLTQEQCELECL